MATEKGPADTAQGVAALVGISAGVVPLVRVLLGGEVGRWLGWIPGTADGAGRWAVPLAVVLIAVVVIGLLERTKRPG